MLHLLIASCFSEYLTHHLCVSLCSPIPLHLLKCFNTAPTCPAFASKDVFFFTLLNSFIFFPLITLTILSPLPYLSLPIILPFCPLPPFPLYPLPSLMFWVHPPSPPSLLLPSKLCLLPKWAFSFAPDCFQRLLCLSSPLLVKKSQLSEADECSAAC